MSQTDNLFMRGGRVFFVGEGNELADGFDGAHFRGDHLMGGQVSSLPFFQKCFYLLQWIFHLKQGAGRVFLGSLENGFR